MTINFMIPEDGGVAGKTFEFIDGKWKNSIDYQMGTDFRGIKETPEDLEAFFKLLKNVQKKNTFMIHGEFIEGVDLNCMVRKKSGDSPTIQDRELDLVCFDVDGYLGGIEGLIEELPLEFHSADYVWQYSSSYGLTSKDGELKCHLFFWLKTPTHNMQIRNWIKDFNKTKGWGDKIIDPSVLTCTQPIYIKKRICIDADDPITDFIGLKAKEGSLNFDFTVIESKGAIKKVSKTADKFDLGGAVKNIIKAENYHEAANRLAMSLLNDSKPEKVKEIMEGLFQAVENKDKRWQDRYDDIDRSIETALEKMTDLVDVDGIMEWIEDSGKKDLEDNFAQKCCTLPSIRINAAVKRIQERTNFGVVNIKGDIKVAQNELALKKAEWAKEKKTRERKSKGVTEIEWVAEDSGRIHDQMCKILANSKKKPELFAMGKRLVYVDKRAPTTISEHQSADELGADFSGEPVIETFDKPFGDLEDRIKKDIVLVDEKGKVRGAEMKTLHLINKAKHPAFNSLSGVNETPYFNHEWELVKEKGYNKSTGLYTTLHRKLELRRTRPKEAWLYLKNVVFDEFPFEGDLDAAVAVAALMTAVQRPMIVGSDGMPGFGIISPLQSSGKTTLAHLIAYSSFNQPAASTPWSDDEDELKKHLLGILLEGHRCVLFDNIKKESSIKGDTLASVMSGDSISGRVLGENKTIKVAASCLWLFTGNNIRFPNDFTTRVYQINLNTNTDEPETRSFKRGDIGKWALDNRKHIVSAVLSLINSGEGLAKGEEGVRFKSWDKFVRRPLEEITGIDIKAAAEANKDDDDDKKAKNTLIRKLHSIFEGGDYTTKKVMEITSPNGFEGGDNELNQALVTILGKRATNHRSVGRCLAGLKNNVHGNLKVLQIAKSNVTKWKIIKLEEK